MPLTDRQQRELAYHAEHAKHHEPYIEFDVVSSPKRRWWNAYWDTWTQLVRMQLRSKRVLVVGCGDGGDAIYFAYAGARVEAFDLSPDMLAIARHTASEHGLNIGFSEAPAESMPYGDGSFDLIYVRDILHHVDIPATMAEIVRVSKPGATLVLNEIYSHSITNKIRYSWLVDKALYRLMRQFVYGTDKPYITEDERKMSEKDIAIVRSHMLSQQSKYFNFIVTRVVPDSIPLLSKCDRILLWVFGGLGRYLAGRIVMIGPVKPI